MCSPLNEGSITVVRYRLNRNSGGGCRSRTGKAPCGACSLSRRVGLPMPKPSVWSVEDPDDLLATVYHQDPGVLVQRALEGRLLHLHRVLNDQVGRSQGDPAIAHPGFDDVLHGVLSFHVGTKKLWYRLAVTLRGLILMRDAS